MTGSSGVTGALGSSGTSGEPASRGLLVALDTATRVAAVAVGDGRGRISAARSWQAGFRHGQELLPVLDAVLREAALQLRDVESFVVGTGPGAFTGLRVGLATAKGLAHALDRPIVGIPSAAALAYAACILAVTPRTSAGATGRDVTVLLPAGPHDRYLARYRIGRPDTAPEVVTPPGLVPQGESFDAPVAGGFVVAVDLPVGPGVPPEAIDIGHEARRALGAGLLALGRIALDRGEPDDVAALVPAYVTLPRGVAAATGAAATGGVVSEREEIAWSRDHR